MEENLKIPGRLPFWLLAVFLCIVFFTGGSTWDSEFQLMLLRPTAFVIAGLAILTLRWEHVTRHLGVLGLFVCVALLAIAHLVPIPYAWWSAIPGREIIVAIDQAAGLGQISRPLSMSPNATLNALYALGVPLAVLLLAIQQEEVDHGRIIVILLALTGISAVFGLIQAGGSSLTLYPDPSAPAGLFANRNHQGALLAIAVPMATSVGFIGCYRYLKVRTKVLIALVALLISLPLLLVTGSRSALVVAAAGILFAMVIWASSITGLKSARHNLGLFQVAFAIIVGGLVWLFIFVSRDLAIERMKYVSEDLRWPVWRSVLDSTPTYLPWGAGIGSYQKVYQVLEPDILLRPKISNHAHNEYLEIAFTAGYPGILLLFVASVAIFIRTIRVFGDWSNSSSAAILSRLGISVVLLIAMASLTDYPTRTPIFSAILALGAIWAFQNSQKVNSRQDVK